LINQRHKG